MKVKLRKVNKMEKQDFPTAVATIRIGRHEAQLTQKELDYLYKELKKFINTKN